jgi:hypothetical protein
VIDTGVAASVIWALKAIYVIVSAKELEQRSLARGVTMDEHSCGLSERTIR